MIRSHTSSIASRSGLSAWAKNGATNQTIDCGSGSTRRRQQGPPSGISNQKPQRTSDWNSCKRPCYLSGVFCWRKINKLRKISPKFSCIKFFQIRDVPTQIPGHPGHSLSKIREKGPLHKVFVRDIPTSGSRMSQEYPAQKLYV